MRRFALISGLLTLLGIGASAAPIVGTVQVNPPSQQAGGFNIQSGTVSSFTITGLNVGGCVQAAVGGQMTTTGLACGSGGGGGGTGGGGTINSSSQYSVPFYSLTSSTVVAGLTPGTSGQVLTTAGSGAHPFWSTPISTSGFIQNSPVQQVGQANLIGSVIVSSVNANTLAIGLKTSATSAGAGIGIFSSATGSSVNYGGQFNSSGGSTNSGVISGVTGTGTNNKGIDASAIGAATNNYGGYFTAAGGTNNYALFTTAGSEHFGDLGTSSNVCTDSAGNLTTSGCSGGGGSGGTTGGINTANQYSAAYYSVSGSSNVVSGSSVSIYTSSITVGNPASTSFSGIYSQVLSSGSAQALRVTSNGEGGGVLQDDNGGAVNFKQIGTPGDNLVIVSSYTSAQIGTSDLLILDRSINRNDPIIRVFKNANNSAPEMRWDSPAPNMEIVATSTDNAHGYGKWEPFAVASQGVDLQVNSRSYDNSTFENLARWHALDSNGDGRPSGLYLSAQTLANDSGVLASSNTSTVRYATLNNHEIGITGPLNTSASWDFRLPATSSDQGQVMYESVAGDAFGARQLAFTSGGSSGQCLTQNGTGAPTWAPCGTGSGVSVYPATATATFPFGLSASTIAVSGSGNFSYQNTGDANIYQVVGSSTPATVGQLPVFSSSHSVVSTGLRNTILAVDGSGVLISTTVSGGSGGGSTSGNIVASPQFQIGTYSGSGSTTTITGTPDITNPSAGNVVISSVSIATVTVNAQATFNNVSSFTVTGVNSVSVTNSPFSIIGTTDNIHQQTLTMNTTSFAAPLGAGRTKNGYVYFNPTQDTSANGALYLIASTATASSNPTYPSDTGGFDTAFIAGDDFIRMSPGANPFIIVNAGSSNNALNLLPTVNQFLSPGSLGQGLSLFSAGYGVLAAGLGVMGLDGTIVVSTNATNYPGAIGFGKDNVGVPLIHALLRGDSGTGTGFTIRVSTLINTSSDNDSRLTDRITFDDGCDGGLTCYEHFSDPIEIKGTYNTSPSTFSTGVIVRGKSGNPYSETVSTASASPGLYVSTNGWTAGDLFVGRSSTVTVVAGTGAGAVGTPTASVTGTNFAGTLTVNTATTPSTSATVATVTTSISAPNKLVCVITPGNGTAALLSGVTNVLVTETANTWIVTSGTSGLTGASTYIWDYICGGY